MNTACLLQDAPIRSKGAKIALPHSLATITPAGLKMASDQNRLRCCDCLETVHLVRRDDKPNHFRHRRCRSRSKAHLKAQFEQFKAELEEARKLIERLTNEGHEAEKVILHIEERWAA